MEAPCAASNKSSMAHSAEECKTIHYDEGGEGKPGDWTYWLDSPETHLVALDDLATKIQTDVTALCMALKSADNSPAIERKRRAYEVVAVMKQQLQHFEKSIALKVTPLDH